MPSSALWDRLSVHGRLVKITPCTKLKELCKTCRDFMVLCPLATFAVKSRYTPVVQLDRMVVYGTSDGGSSPPGSTIITLSSNWIGPHPFTVKIYGFESRRRDTLELWQTWCMRRTENPKNEVQFREAPQHGDCSSVGQSAGLWFRKSRVRVPSVTPNGNIAQWQSGWLLTIGS